MLGAVALAGIVAPAAASSLAVSPILIDVVAKANSAGSLTLSNRDGTPARLQVRVFRWRQQDGADVLEPTSDVAASPPFVTLAPGLPYVVRVVRTSTRTIAAEESYRLLVDELPEPGRPSGDIRFAVRHSLPVFFRSPDAVGSDVAWSARVDGSEMRLTAANRGDRRLRIANLRVVAADGTQVSFGAGLLGSALGHAERTWPGPAVDPRFRLAGAHVEFDGDCGPRRADLTASAPAGTV